MLCCFAAAFWCILPIVGTVSVLPTILHSYLILYAVSSPLWSAAIVTDNMEPLSLKIDNTKLQEEKLRVIKKDAEIERKLCDIKDKLDTLLIEKEKILKTNIDIDARLELFKQKYVKYKNKEQDILNSDTNIEDKYDMLKQEHNLVGSERENIIKQKETLENKREILKEQLEAIEDEKKCIQDEDERIEIESMKIHIKLENLFITESCTSRNVNDEFEKRLAKILKLITKL